MAISLPSGAELLDAIPGADPMLIHEVSMATACLSHDMLFGVLSAGTLWCTQQQGKSWHMHILTPAFVG
jgi:hypothetical protein